MKSLILILCFFVITVDSQSINFNKEQDSTDVKVETQIDSIRVEESDGFGNTVNKLFGWGKEKDEQIEMLTKKVKIQRSLIDSMSSMLAKPKVVIKTVPMMDPNDIKSVREDEKFITGLPKSYGNMPKNRASELTKQIDQKIQDLIKQRDSILSVGNNSDLLDAKNNAIQSLQREKSVIKLSQESNTLKTENDVLNVENADLKVETNELKWYLYTSLAILFVLLLTVAVILQRKKIRVQDVEIDRQLADINKKNNYLEHAARIIRHDMHSGINTYMPRGLSSLERNIDENKAKELKIDMSIKMIREGLNHTQKVYRSVYEFTNLVKKDVVLDVKNVDLKSILEEYIKTTAYSKQVEISELIYADVNPTLFCTAIDNLIRNGLNFNDSNNKLVRIYMQGSELVIEDNGRGLTKTAFDEIKKNRGTSGLGLSIALAIIEEHGFNLVCEEISSGTKMKVILK